MSSTLCKLWTWLLKLFTDLLQVIADAMEVVIDTALGLVGSVVDGVGELLGGPLMWIALAAGGFWLLSRKSDEDESSTEVVFLQPNQSGL